MYGAVRCYVGVFLGISAVHAAQVAWAEETQPTPEAPTRYVPIDVTIFPPLRIMHFEKQVVTGLSLNALWGTNDAVYGIEVGGLVNYERMAFGGVQLAGVANWVGGDAGGLQIAGILNHSENCRGALQVAGTFNTCGRGAAAQFAIVANSGGEEFVGLQVGLLGNVVESANFDLQLAFCGNDAVKDFSGVQIGLANFSNQTVPTQTGSCGYNCAIWSFTAYPNAVTRGLQLGVSNFAQNMRGVQLGVFNGARSLEGTQLGWLSNITSDMSGLQLAGFVNVATGDVSGAQVCLLVNFATDVNGIQIAAINIARRLRGVQIGGINVAYGNTLPVMVGLNAGF